MITSHRYRLKIFWILMAGLALAGCRPGDDDRSDLISMEIVTEKAGFFHHVAWLDKTQIAMAYSPSVISSPQEQQIYLYRLDASQWQEVKVPKPAKCLTGEPIYLNRLPGGLLSYTYDCTIGAGANGLLYIQNSAGQFERWAELRHPPADFTFSPDMTQAIQASLGKELYQLAQTVLDGKRMLADFFRATSPRYSPDGTAIAFAGIAAPSQGIGTPFSTDPEGLRAPYDLYLMQAQDGALQLLVSGIRYPQYVKWSPGGAHISFQGEYQDTDGIWIVNLENQQVTRLWHQLSFYDWSPDGTQMIVMKRNPGEEPQALETQPVILDLPVEFHDPPQE